MRSPALLLALALLSFGLLACGQDTGNGTVSELREQLQAEQERADAAEERISELEQELGIAADDTDDADQADEIDVSELGDTPHAYTHLSSDGVAPDVAQEDGEVTVTFGPVSDWYQPFIVYNGTSGPVSRIEVSGSFVADGEVVTSGSSLPASPNVVEAGGIALGQVLTDDNLPGGATIEEPTIDYTNGLGDFETIVVLEIEAFELLDGSLTGTVANPHDIDVEGPIGVGVACLDNEGNLIDVIADFADRDTIEAGGTSSFTISFFGQTLVCDGVLVAASGYDTDF